MIVTGGARGLGPVRAQGLAVQGARVVVADVDAHGAQETVDAIITAGGRGSWRESYRAAKAGVNQLTRVMAIELAKAGIRVIGIAPGYLEKVMLGARDERADSVKQRWIEMRTPMGRRARLEELVGPVCFLLSSAASYVTGAILAVDGGFTAS